MPCRLLLVALVLASPAVAADPAAVEHFEKKVRPLFLSHCAKCHDDAKAKGGLKMTSRAAVLAGGDTGPSVVPGKPAESLLLKAVRYTDDAACIRLGARMAGRLAEQIGMHRLPNVVFMGRVGEGRSPHSRSLRLPLKTLMHRATAR